MAVETRGLIPSIYEDGLESIFGVEYDSIPKKCDIIFDEVNSSDQEWHGQEVTGFGVAQVKDEAASIHYDTRSPGYKTVIRPVTVALGFMISREAVEDNKYVEAGNANARNLANSMAQFQEIRAANEFNRAFDAAYVKGDGVSLISGAHPTGDGTQSNTLDAPADLSEAALEDMHIKISKARNSRGLKVQVMAKSLIIPTELRYQAQRILGSNLRVGTQNNDTNALRDLNDFPDQIEWNYLEDPKAWFVKTNLKGLHYVNRRAIEFKRDDTFDTEVHKFKSTQRYEYGSTEWRTLWGVQGV